MKKFKFNKVSKIVLAVLFTIGLSGSLAVFAASNPPLGLSSTFGILSSTFTRNIGLTVITGDLGYTTLSGGGTHTISGDIHVVGNTYNTAGADQATALAALNAQLPCTFTFANGAIDLATDTTHGSIGVYTPGVYCTGASSAASIGTAGITLNGIGTYIFRINGALTTVNNSNVRLSNSASSCDVFWTPTSATTLGANTTFIGTVIDAAGITVGHNTGWNGRALAFGGTVTTDTNKINSTCLTTNPTVLVDEVISTPSVSHGGSSVTYGCKDPKATNYNYFSSSNPALCLYTTKSIYPITAVTLPIITPLLPKTGFPPGENNTWYKSLINNILNVFR